MKTAAIGRMAAAVLFVLAAGLLAQSPGKSGFRLDAGNDPRPASNGMNDLMIAGGRVWAANGEGLSVTADRGASWRNIGHEDGIGKGGISALDVCGNRVWAATGYDTLTSVDPSALPAGGGVGTSADGGETWVWMPQPVDSREETRYSPTTTHVQNITYDLAIVPGPSDTTVWIASFAGGFRKSSDRGRTWEVVTVDGRPFDPVPDLSHRAFSIHFDGRSLWAGSAGGVHRSDDNGLTWTTFSHRSQPRGISGNFVVAIATQKNAGRSIVWAATIETTSESGDTTETRGVSMSEDGGLTWSVKLPGVFAHNFAFHGPSVYVATDSGLYVSPDFGGQWALFGPIADKETGAIVTGPEVNCAAVDSAASDLWVGTSDGLALTGDGGATWSVFRSFRTPGAAGEPDTYAYPNPFSPFRDNLIGENGHVRFQYRLAGPARVTVRVYDFSMRLVAEAVTGRERPAAGDYAEMWDGRNDYGEAVANGVYFYRIDVSGGKSRWGKVIVMN
ncbi:MAG: FlgD immunoglobulin-like domain containing protein [bacterium]|nr:FlgD immunoglobulin-like domain containing protein [bacterium]